MASLSLKPRHNALAGQREWEMEGISVIAKEQERVGIVAEARKKRQEETEAHVIFKGMTRD